MAYLKFYYRPEYQQLLTSNISIIKDIHFSYIKLEESDIFAACKLGKKFGLATIFTYHQYKYHSTLDFRNSSLLNLGDTYFEECDFSQAQVINFNVRGGHAKDCNLQKTKFIDNFFHDFQFKNCNLTQSQFLNCSVQGVYGSVVFSNCVIDNTIFNFTNQYSNCSAKLYFFNNKGKDIVMRNNKFTHNEVYIKDSDITGDFTGTYFGTLIAPQKFKFYFIKQGGSFGNMNLFHRLYQSMYSFL